MNYNERLREKITLAEQHRDETEQILKAAKPRKKTGFAEFIHDMVFGLGLKNVFYGIMDVAVITIAAAAGMIALLYGISPEYRQADFELYGLVFALSPLIYMTFFLLSFIKEKTEGCFDVKMSCRYTALHLCAFRMFVCGIFCMIINAISALVIALRAEISFTELAAISFSSLFLFALVMILSLMRFGAKGCFVPLGIMAACLILSSFSWFNTLLKNIPTAAYLILGAVLLVLNQSVLNKINRRYSYAVR